MEWLIAYDIAAAKRLRRVARILEKRGVRTQYSVFHFLGTTADVETLLDELATVIRKGTDVVQAWPINGPTCDGLSRGCARPIRPATVIIAAGTPTFIRRLPPPNTHEG